MKIFILAITLFFSTGVVYGQMPQLQLQKEWSQKDHIIQDVTFGNKGNTIAFIKRFQSKDSTRIAFPAEAIQTENLLPGKGDQKRFRDPVVSLLDITSGHLTIIDYGWSPNFAPDNNRVVYTHQVSPLKESKIFASGLKGNDIFIFDIQKKAIQKIATAAQNFLMDPVFIDSVNIIYKSGSAVNGPYAGGITFQKLNLDTKKTELVKTAKIQYRLYDIMGNVYGSGKNYSYMVYSPQDSGIGLASEYAHLLMRGKDTLHNFGTRRFINLQYKFALLPNDEIVYLDDNHLLADDTSFLFTYSKEKIESKKPLLFNYTEAYVSPNGKSILYITPGLEAFVMRIDNFMKTQLPLPKKEFHSLAWSSDGTQLAIVQDHKDLENTDALYIYKLKI